MEEGNNDDAVWNASGAILDIDRGLCALWNGIIHQNCETVSCCGWQAFVFASGSWADRSPLHDAAIQGRLLALRNLILQVSQR